ncbi:MAG: hypothetical protein JW755_08370, partial [Candidatus Aminicenantes bacterium]|nr:hypothetical protein [Candidatus Aminicenantes bacterium]
VNTRLLQSSKRTAVVSFSLIFFIVSFLTFRLLFPYLGNWFRMLYWVWVELFTITSVTQFWILVNEFYHPHQAKRLFGFLVSGGLTGGIAGSLIATFLAKKIGTANLIFFCPVTLFFCLLIVRTVSKSLIIERKTKTHGYPKGKKTGKNILSSFSLLKNNRYFYLLTGMMITTIMITTFIDFQFNSIIEITYVDKDARTSFLGLFFTLLLTFSYILHIILTNRILKNFGLKTALLIAPIIIFFTALSLFLIPVYALIYWAVFIKGADKSISHSLSQTVRELLYIPILPETKYRVKILIDMFINKFARGFAGILLIIFISILNFPLKYISLITAVTALLWIILNLLIYQEYVNLIKTHLKIKWKDAERIVSETVDLDLTKMVFDTLQSREKSPVLYAMNLFDLIKNEKISPELRKAISKKSDIIKASSMDSLLELDGEALLPAIEDEADDQELSIQIEEIMSQDSYQDLMTRHIEEAIRDNRETTEVSKMEAAKIMGMMKPSRTLILILKKLLLDPSLDVNTYALDSAAKIQKRELLPYIINLLSKKPTQRNAGETLVAFGDRITGTLKDYLWNSDGSMAIRKNIPDILQRINSQRAVDVLVESLVITDPEIINNVIEALYKLREKNGLLQYDHTTISKKIFQIAENSLKTFIEIQKIKHETKNEQKLEQLNSSIRTHLKQIFELLTLIYPKNDINTAYQNITAGTKKSLDYSLELLDNILDKDIREMIFPMIDDSLFENKVSRIKYLLKKKSR